MRNPVKQQKISLQSSDMRENIPVKRNRGEIRPLQEIQHDMIDRMPDYDSNKEASRCKLKEHKGKIHAC